MFDWLVSTFAYSEPHTIFAGHRYQMLTMMTITCCP
jgi:hypothetical protein